MAIVHILHSDVHAFRRVPLYVDSQPGLDDVALEQGIENARRTLAGKVDCEFSQSKSIELPTLVEELANEGAAAVELRNEMLVRFDVVDLRIPLAFSQHETWLISTSPICIPVSALIAAS